MRKPNHLLKVNPEQFFEVKTKEIAYILGYLWGDGWLYHQGSSYGIFICTTDYFLNPILSATGQWLESSRRRENRKKSYTYQFSSIALYEYLISMDYKSKDKSPDKVLKTIPDHLKHYWFRGLSDADGCFYIGKNKSIRQFSMAGTYTQDWKYMEDLLKELDIYYKVVRTTSTRSHTSSIVRITNKLGVAKFGDYIYQEYDGLGLPRKYDKYIEIISGMPSRTHYEVNKKKGKILQKYPDLIRSNSSEEIIYDHRES